MLSITSLRAFVIAGTSDEREAVRMVGICTIRMSKIDANSNKSDVGGSGTNDIIVFSFREIRNLKFRRVGYAPLKTFLFTMPYRNGGVNSAAALDIHIKASWATGYTFLKEQEGTLRVASKEVNDTDIVLYK